MMGDDDDDDVDTYNADDECDDDEKGDESCSWLITTIGDAIDTSIDVC